MQANPTPIDHEPGVGRILIGDIYQTTDAIRNVTNWRVNWGLSGIVDKEVTLYSASVHTIANVAMRGYSIELHGANQVQSIHWFLWTHIVQNNGNFLGETRKVLVYVMRKALFNSLGGTMLTNPPVTKRKAEDEDNFIQGQDT
ncbi:hypothetical protein NX059_004046 [Plenodomus lindquistii]|nr:hypothetical protein NX059_004046 [Plenodomus lindquistii]